MTNRFAIDSHFTLLMGGCCRVSKLYCIPLVGGVEVGCLRCGAAHPLTPHDLKDISRYTSLMSSDNALLVDFCTRQISAVQGV